MVGLNTTQPQVFWNGQAVPGIVGISVDNDAQDHRVTLRIKEDALISELKAAGIIVRRVSA